MKWSINIKLGFYTAEVWIDLMESIIRKIILNNFFRIALSTDEGDIAENAIKRKYLPSLKAAFLLSFLLLPATIFLDTETIISVLIPISMVSGTAWFSVSLASMKKKFEAFGLELTRDLFTAFVLSLFMLFFLTLSSLTVFVWKPYILGFENLFLYQCISAFLALVVVFYLMWYIYNGSLKYDINDSMLSGQNEAAEIFFKRSLSILHKTAEDLRQDKSMQVANYLIGVSFYEIYSIMERFKVSPNRTVESRKNADKLIFTPAMNEDVANGIAYSLIEEFLFEHTNNDTIVTGHKSFKAIEQELKCLKENDNEKQDMVDIRLSVTFEEMANLIEVFGERLFVRKRT